MLIKFELLKTKIRTFLSNRVSSSAVFVSPIATEIYNTIFSLKTKLNPELDISSYFLKVAAIYLSLFLTLLFRQVSCSGIFPDSLKIAKVFPVFKAGSKTDVNIYRPVSILPCLLKLIEKLILKSVTSFLDKHENIQPHQFGFRKKHSSIHAFLDKLSSCYDAINEKIFYASL